MSEGDVGTGSKFSHALTKKLGPLPGYAWVGLAVGGFIVWHKLHGGSSSAGAVPAGTTDTTLGGTPGTLDSGSGGGGGGGQQDAGQGAGFFVDPNTALLEQELQQLLSAQSQQQTPNPNDNAPPAQPPPGNVDVYGHPLSGGPIFAYSGGQLVGYNPSAQSAFSTSTPASAGYNALGVKPSDPITLLPTQLGPNDTGAPRLIPTSGAIPV